MRTGERDPEPPRPRPAAGDTTCLPVAVAVRGRRPGVLALAVLAVSHVALAVSEGLEDGDFTLLWFDAFFVVPTLAAAGLCQLGRPGAVGLARVLTVAVLLLAWFSISAYGLGLFHLPQAAAASVVAFLWVRDGRPASL